VVGRKRLRLREVNGWMDARRTADGWFFVFLEVVVYEAEDE